MSTKTRRTRMTLDDAGAGDESSVRWWSVHRAAAFLGIRQHRIEALVRKGYLEVLVLPGCMPLVSVADMHRLREECHRPARRPAPAEVESLAADPA
jgi:hypothetical protein